MAMTKSSKPRCAWPGDDPLMLDYHDSEWGTPLSDDHLLFEFLILEGMQAGLSWRTVLHKRENFRMAFSEFDPREIARYDSQQIERLMQNEGIIRNRLKIESAVKNARAYLKAEKDVGSFSKFLWTLSGPFKPAAKYKSLSELPASTDQSIHMSKSLLKAGFKFVGPTICYALMQATGMVNDHVTSCYRFKEIERIRRRHSK